MLRLFLKFLGATALFCTALSVSAQESTPKTKPKTRPETAQETSPDSAPETVQKVAQEATPVPERDPSDSDAIVMYSTPPKIAPQPMLAALAAADRGDWPWAESLAARAGPGAVALVQSRKFLAGQGTAREMVEFTAKYPNWPDLDAMRAVTEAALTGAPPQDIVDYFHDIQPQSGKGAMLYAEATAELGDKDKANTIIIEAWRTLDLSTDEHDDFVAKYGKLLAPYHAERLDMTLWRGLKDTEQMLPLVNQTQRTRAEARRAIKNGTADMGALLSSLSADDKHDPGVAFELFDYYIRSDQKDNALKTLREQSKRKNGLGRPGEWAGWRLYFARSAMDDKDYKTAYELASKHGLSEGAKFADLEWLSGYIALSYLNDPLTAAGHFLHLVLGVNTPISLGRAWYWAGRAYEAAQDPEVANEAYMQGAEYQSSYYGLLAAEKAGVPYDLDADTPVQPANTEAEPLYGAAIMARASGETQLSLRLLYALADSAPESSLPELGQLVEGWGDPFYQIKLGKRLARRGVILPRHYFAMHPLAKMKLPVPTELALSIARRESEFNPTVRSEAGAEGLMQVMPGTAKEVASALGIAYDPDKPLNDWGYNALLGSSYLARMAQTFDGNIVMIAAGYNAGPGRPAQWMERFGDPRKPGGINIVDWIELIPFNETRNYVMRVTESLPIYRKRLGKPPLPQPFSQELAGSSFAEYGLQPHMTSSN